MPSTILSDNGVTSGTAGIKTTGSNDGQLALQTTTAGGTATTALTIDTSQNVGIGTTSPSQKLTIGNGGKIALVRASATNTGFVYTDSNGTILESDTTNSDPVILTSPGTGGTIRMSTAGTERMRIDSSGNVGIGQTSPASKLHVKSGTNTDATAIGTFEGATSNTFQIGYGSVGAWFNVVPADPLQFKMAGTERARITSGGFFKASNNGSYYSSTGAYHELYSSQTNNWASRTTSSTASVPYGTEIAFTGVTPNNTTSIFLNCGDTTNDKCTIYSTGTINNRTGTFAAYSDIKLKQDIVDAGSQWDDIKALRIRKFRLKDEVAADPNYPAYIGLIAQEAEQVSPGLVDNCPDFENVTKTREVEKTREIEVTPAVLDEEGNIVESAVTETETYTETEEYTERVATGTVTKSLKYSILYMKAVKALQEAMTRIETLEAQNAAFEARLAALESK